MTTRARSRWLALFGVMLAAGPMALGAGVPAGDGEGLLALTGGKPIAAAASASIPETRYFHANAPAASIDGAAETTRRGRGPWFDATPPASPAPKIGVTTAFANQKYRKNSITSYWGGSVNGVVSELVVTIWAKAAAGTTLEVNLFGDGGIGSASPFARTTVAGLSPAPTQYEVAFPGLVAGIEEELVVQVGSYRGTTPTDTEVLFDSTTFPSGLRFALRPLSAGVELDDPAGIAFRGTDAVVANAGSGDLVSIADGVPADVLATGIVPGGFLRGITGVAVDANGTVFAAVADTGELLAVPADDVARVYARDLGAPMGVALDDAGNVFVADAAGKRLLKVDATRNVTEVAALASAPYGVALAPDGAIAVSLGKDPRVVAIDPSTGTVSDLAALGSTDSAEGIAFGASGALYVGSGRQGAVVRVRDDVAARIATGLGGPLNLAFRPGTTTLAVATQGEGRTGNVLDAIVDVDAGEPGSAPASPALATAPVTGAARAWVHEAGARAVASTAFGAPLPQATSSYVGRDAAEPTLGVQPDGDVFFVASAFDAGEGQLARSEVYRSGDAGRSWQEVTPTTPAGDAPPTTLDPYVWVDPTTGRVFSVDLYLGCSYLTYSDDDGRTWTTNPIACGDPVNDHQTMSGGVARTSTTFGYPNVLYYCSNQLVQSGCGRSLDGGDTWTPAGLAYPPASICGAGLTGHVVVDAKGRVLLPRGGGDPCIAVSEDDGVTWNQYKVSTTVKALGHETHVASDIEGNLYYTWIGAADRQAYLATSTDGGKTWSTPKMVSPPGVTETNLPAIAAYARGSVAVLYMGTTLDYGYGARAYAKAAWNGYITIATNALSDKPVFATTTANPLGDPLFRGECGPGRCGSVFDFLDIVVAPDGRPWGTFVDACTGVCVRQRAASSSDGEGVAAPLVAGPNLRTGAALEAP